MKRLILALLVGALPGGLLAAPFETDLGRGLGYLRVHELPADLPPLPAAGRAPPCVVDVRYVEADAEAAQAFIAWVKGRATLRTPVFVLANSATSLPLRRVITGHGRGTGIVLVGVSAPGFKPDVEVKGAGEAERRAYDALEQGTPVAKLLTENPDKVRNDEASLSKDRLAEAAADAADDALAGKVAAPGIDSTLQRAVHLHRALVALKKL